ncbi:PorP/SprF family type IX secretion system membrane protein [Halocola ammonii]
MKKILLIATGICMAVALQAQQELQVSQYMFNGLFLNPAYAGSHEYFSASALHRSQWVNFDGAPSTQLVSIDGPLADNKLGVGLIVSNDRIGITNQFEASANFAYHLETGAGKLSFGLRAGLSMYSADFNEIQNWDENDPVYQNGNIENQAIPKFGAGIYYYTDKFYAGVSVPTIIAADDNLIPEGSSQSSFFEEHFFLNAGYVFETSGPIAIKPSFLAKYQQAAPMEFDINCNFYYNNFIGLGVGYRTGDAVVGMLDINITNQFRVGYAYDYTLSDINDFANGSHEIMLGFDFGKNVDIKTRSPRYF